MVYLFLGFSLIPLAKKSPKYFGPAKEVMAFLVVYIGLGGGLGVLVACAFAFLWPVVLLISLFLPSLTLDDQLESSEGRKQTQEPELIGSVAYCLSELKPSGLIEVGGCTYDATSLNDFIPKGCKVKIVRKQAFNYVVEKIS